MDFKISLNSFKGLVLGLTLLASWQSYAATTIHGAACLKDATAVSDGDPRVQSVQVEKGDLKAFRDAKPLVDGGAVQLPVGDQEDAEICWSYAECELVAGEYFKSTGKVANLAPDHNGFWHLYFEVFEHGKYFEKLAAKVASNQISLEEATREAVMMLHSRPNSGSAKAVAFEVDSGNDEPTALREAKIVGFVPHELFDRPIKSPEQANDLTAALKDLVSTIIKDSSKSTLFDSKDDDGINTPLFNLMTTKLASVLKSSSTNNHLPYRPNDKFTVDNVEYTPVTYMTNELKFDPDNYVNVALTESNYDLVDQAAKEALLAKMPLILGFVVLNQITGQKDMIWSTDMLDNVKVVINGGHAVLIVNAKINGVDVVGHIFLNSWGKQGLDINGVPAANLALTGYDGITKSYHLFSVKIKEPSEFVFRKDFLAQAKYKSLLDDAAAQEAARRHLLPPISGH